MSGLNDKKKSFTEFSIGKFLFNIEKLRMVTKRIKEFDNTTPIKILETYEQLLDFYWKHCTYANLEAGNDIPFDSNVFWWQTYGDIGYQASSERLSDLLISYKVIILTNAHTFTSFHRVTWQIWQFDETTAKPLLEISVELLEHYWLQFSEAYCAIVKGKVVPTRVANVYIEIESYYINAKIKIKRILLCHSEGSTVPQIAQNYDEIEDKADLIVESVGQMTHCEQSDETTDQSNEITDQSNENLDDSTTKSNEELDEPTVHIKKKSCNLFFSTIRRLIDWVRLFWSKRYTSSETGKC